MLASLKKTLFHHYVHFYKSAYIFMIKKRLFAYLKCRPTESSARGYRPHSLCPPCVCYCNTSCCTYAVSNADGVDCAFVTEGPTAASRLRLLLAAERKHCSESDSVRTCSHRQQQQFPGEKIKKCALFFVCILRIDCQSRPQICHVMALSQSHVPRHHSVTVRSLWPLRARGTSYRRHFVELIQLTLSNAN